MSNRINNLRRIVDKYCGDNPKDLKGIDIDKEYEMIEQKKSKLSHQMRTLVLLLKYKNTTGEKDELAV